MSEADGRRRGPSGESNGRDMRQTFRPGERIQRRADFQRIYTRGQKLHGRFMTLFVLATGTASARLGVAATRKLGDAVRRNRAKRLARELFRRHKPGPGTDLVLVPKRELLAQSFTRLETEFEAMIRRAGCRRAPRAVPARQP